MIGAPLHSPYTNAGPAPTIVSWARGLHVAEVTAAEAAATAAAYAMIPFAMSSRATSRYSRAVLWLCA